jgi:CDP-diacylglycerol---glycerol-3-phosphate 3-phosphatidyltransferase
MTVVHDSPKIASTPPWPRKIAYGLIALRGIIGPLLLLDALDGFTGRWFLVGLVTAFVTDVLDGLIPGRTGTITVQLREFDGRTDIWLYGWIAASAWLTQRDFLIANYLPLLLVLGSQLLAWVVEWIKYRRFSNYHSYAAKVWAITLLLFTLSLFGVGPVDVYLWLVVVAGLVCTIEEIAITLLLPQWTVDVPSLFHAMRRRTNMRKRSDG